MGRFVFTLAVGVWLGTLVSFSYVILSGIHAWAPDGGARALLRRLFPRYHLVGIVCGLLALAAVATAAPSASFGTHERVLLGAPVALALALPKKVVRAARFLGSLPAARPRLFQFSPYVAADRHRLQLVASPPPAA